MLGGLFVADEISIADGRFTLFPALRFDTYNLDATDDPLLPTFAEADQSGSHFSPKLGAVAKLTDELRLFANYAQGFKAPSPSQVNNFFENPAQGYKSLPNPDLEPETSRTFEGGVRYVGGNFSIGVTGFLALQELHRTGRNHRPALPKSADGLQQYQWVNLHRGRNQRDRGARRPEPQERHHCPRSRFAYADGRSDPRRRRQRFPLVSVDPITLVARPRLPRSRRHFRRRGDRDPQCAQAAGPHRRLVRRRASGPRLRPSLDATAFVRIAEMLTLRAGVFNLLDEKYANWSDVRGLAVAPPPPPVDRRLYAPRPQCERLRQLPLLTFEHRQPLGEGVRQ